MSAEPTPARTVTVNRQALSDLLETVLTMEAALQLFHDGQRPQRLSGAIWHAGQALEREQ